MEDRRIKYEASPGRRDVVNSACNSLDSESDPEMIEISQREREREDKERLKGSILNYLNENGAGWKDIPTGLGGHNHKGWSRLATIGKKSRTFYDLLREEDNKDRNACERDLSDQGITFQDDKTWDKISYHMVKAGVEKKEGNIEELIKYFNPTAPV